MKTIAIFIIFIVVCITIDAVVYNSNYELFTDNATSNFDVGSEFFCIDLSGVSGAVYTIYPSYGMNSDFSLKFEKDKLNPASIYIIHRYRIMNWGDSTSEGWCDNNTHTYSHDYPNVGQSQTYQIQVELDVYTAYGDQYAYIQRTVGVTIFPTPDQSLQTTALDDLYYYNGNNNSIKDPVLVVEGYDATNTQNIPFYYSKSPDLIDNLIDDYNVYFLNYHDGSIDMRENAMRTLGALRFIGQRYPSSKGIRAIGISMGGITLRYALAFAEENVLNHFTSAYVSLDAPQRGVYMNSELLSDLHEILNVAEGIEQLGVLHDVLVAPATKQLLRSNPYAVNNRNFESGSDDFLSFYSELNPAENAKYFEYTGNSTDILNDDPNNPHNKPGYPYKFNSIKSLCISNGKEIKPENIMYEDQTNYIHMHLNFQVPLWGPQNVDLNVHKCRWDGRPGSLLTSGTIDYRHFFYWYFGIVSYDVSITSNYDAAFIHSFSSMDLQNYDLVTAPTLFTDLSSSRFDEIWHLDDSSEPLQHTEISTLGNNQLLNWVSQLEYYSTGTIDGQIENANTAVVRAYLGEYLFYQGTTDLSGNYSVPYPLINSADVRIEFIKEGYYTKNIVIPVSYSNGLTSYNSLTAVLNHIEDEVRVSNTALPQGNLFSIQEAIDFALGHGIPRVRIYSGTFQENLEIIPGTSTDIVELEILGSGVGTIIEPNTLDAPCIMVYSDETNPVNLKIRNLVVQNGRHGMFTIFEPHDYPDNIFPPTEILIEDCTIRNMTSDPVTPIDGVGIYADGPIHLERVNILNNTGVHNQAFSYWSKGGGANLTNNESNSPTIINKCNIIGNTASEAGGLYLNGTGKFIITNNTIANNFRKNAPIMGQVNNVFSDGVSHLIVSGNIVTNDISPNAGSGHNLYVKNSGTSANPCLITNNTITGNLTSLPSNSIGILIDGVSCYAVLKNNIIQNSSTAIKKTEAGSQLQMNYSLFWNNPSNFDGCAFNITTNPESFFNINPQLDALYRPMWDTVVKSPCIDNGNPDTDGDGIKWYNEENSDDKDIDGSQKDIGALALSDTHIHKYHRINGGEIKYISFPGLYNPATANNIPAPETSIEYVFDTFHDNDMFAIYPDYILNSIKWMTNSELGIYTIQNPVTHNICSQYGYKVELRDTYSGPPKVIEYQGYRPGNAMNIGMKKPGTNLNTSQLFIKQPQPNNVDPNCHWNRFIQGYEREIYLGYYLEASLHPFDALEPILDNISAIYAEDWALVRIPQLGGGGYSDNWEGCLNCGLSDVAINPGDMVVVYYFGSGDVEFKWNGENPNPPFVDEYYRKMPTYFGPHEQFEYVPIYVEFDLDEYEDGNKPLEVAIFVDDICKGAAVIKEGQVQLNAYIADDPTIELKDLQFRMYFPGKSEDQIVNGFSVKNYQTGIYETLNANVADCGKYLKIHLDNPDNASTPILTALIGNYPNPFNPETMIKVDIANSGQAKLEVFNVKGQLVKTLVSGSIKAGSYAYKWNGYDNNNNPVCSGVYFYRLSTGGKCLTNKMLMLK